MWNRRRSLIFFGALTIVFWGSLLIYLPPIHLTDGMRGLIRELRDAPAFLFDQSISDTDLESMLVRSVRWEFAKSLALIVLGVLSGVLLIMRRRVGALLAVALCSLELLRQLVNLMRMYPHIREWLNVLFTIWFPLHPARVLHVDIVGTLFFIVTIAFLARRGAWRQFR